MRNFSEHKELIQEFSKTFNVGIVDICNFIQNTESENKIYKFIKSLEKEIVTLSEKYHNKFMFIDEGFIKIDRLEIDDEYDIIVIGTFISFYEKSNDRENIELSYDSFCRLGCIEMNVTTIENIENKIKTKIISEDELKMVFNEKFDALKERCYHDMFGTN